MRSMLRRGQSERLALEQKGESSNCFVLELKFGMYFLCFVRRFLATFHFLMCGCYGLVLGWTSVNLESRI